MDFRNFTRDVKLEFFTGDCKIVNLRINEKKSYFAEFKNNWVGSDWLRLAGHFPAGIIFLRGFLHCFFFTGVEATGALSQDVVLILLPTQKDYNCFSDIPQTWFTSAPFQLICRVRLVVETTIESGRPMRP